MTTEEKARAYDEALERARALRQEAIDKEYAIDYVKDYEAIFPELRESEDERVRRTLVEYFGPKVQLDFVRGVPIQKIRDWLEKQKEQKVDIDKLRRDLYQSGYNDGYQHGKEDAQKEQKPAEWSEDSVKYKEGFKAGRESGLRDGQKYVLNNLDSYGLCKLAEWSEEDEKMLISIVERGNSEIPKGECGLTPNQVAWLETRLKSLRPDSYKNCNSRWKPSEEQMDALNKARRFIPYNCDILESLYEQLKKL